MLLEEGIAKHPVNRLASHQRILVSSADTTGPFARIGPRIALEGDLDVIAALAMAAIGSLLCDEKAVGTLVGFRPFMLFLVLPCTPSPPRRACARGGGGCFT